MTDTGCRNQGSGLRVDGASVAARLYIVYRLLGPVDPSRLPVDPSFQALSERLQSTVRRNKFIEDSFLLVRGGGAGHEAFSLTSSLSGQGHRMR